MSMSVSVPSIYDSPDGRVPEWIVRDIQKKISSGKYSPKDFIQTIDSYRGTKESQKWYPIAEMLEFGYLTESELRQWVEQWCDALARELYQSATKQYADYISHPEYLAWGLSRKLFSKSELKFIRFDHGEDGGNYVGENYVKTYLSKDFIESIIKQLRDPISWEREKERIKHNVEQTRMRVKNWCDDGHCCC